MFTRIAEFHSFLFGSLKMSDALIALISALMTTVGLAIINKLMSRPTEHWKQAQDLREELRKDLTRAQGDLYSMKDKSYERDAEYMDLKQQLITMGTDLRNVSEALRECEEKHDRVGEEIAKVRDEFKNYVRSGSLK